MNRTILAASIILLASGFLIADEEEERRTLTVTGTAEVMMAPDICYMSFVVESTHRKAGDAYQENVATMNAINAAIKAQGIEAKDMRTAQFSFTPQYRYTNNRSIFEGYRVYNTLKISVRDLSKVSAVLDAAVEAGAKDVEYINFTVENPKQHTEEARREALRQARKKAEESAGILGFTLGTPISVSESEPWDYRHYAQDMMAGSGYAMDQTAAPALEAGQVNLSRTVYVTYEILER